MSGQTAYNSISQIFNASFFGEMIGELALSTEEKNTYLLPFFEKFLMDSEAPSVEKKYNVEAIKQLLLALTANSLEQVDASPNYYFPKLGHERDLLVKFVEALFGLWRSKHRFIIRFDRFTGDRTKRIFKQMVLTKTNNDLRNLVLGMYSQIMTNITDMRMKIMRQEPAGAQAGFMVSKLEPAEENILKDAQWLYDIPFIWGMVFEPPVIFYTRSNTRSGVFGVRDESILWKMKEMEFSDWLAMPIHVGKKLIFVVVNREYLAHAAGLGNLFELASFNVLMNRKPDGIYIFGAPEELFDRVEDRNGVIYREEDGTYVALVGDSPSIDYFGYMKKMILTVHNLLTIDEGKMPVHGALAHIKLISGKTANVLLIGDSGAGKSETLDALLRLSDRVSEVDILIDDMGSLEIDSQGRVVAYGTETGAFVRLDDLQPGYAYSTIDRSIFMNPHEVNARVIVPYSNYNDIIRPTRIEYMFYANNYEEPEEGQEISFFEDVESAMETFSKGARMAKGTTSEKGLTYSYFANPFGAVQRREVHHGIAQKHMRAMMEAGVKVGELKTRLGIPGFEHSGPLKAADKLLQLIEST